MKIQKGYSKKIADNLTLRIAVGNIDELQRFISFNDAVHQEESLEKYINRLFLEHPERDEIYWIYIEENNSKKLISSITLAPLVWDFDRTSIPICEMGLVGTLAGYRNKGLMGILNQLYENIMEQKGYLISAIRGIPYYYRRFGYEFALNLDERIILNKSQIPLKEIEEISFRKATKLDLNFIKSIYNKQSERFFITNKFNQNNFYYKFINIDFDNNFSSTYLIEVNGRLKSFFSLGMSYDNVGYSLVVPEVNEKCMFKIIQFVNNLNKEKDQIVFQVNSNTKFSQYIFSIGGKKSLGYGWQIRIPNIKKFLHAISLVLEQRIERSSYKGLTQDVVISNYKEIFTLIFKNGKIEAIKVKKGYPIPGSCDVQIPNSFLIKLLLSDRSFEEIKYIVRDSMLRSGSEELIKILFPKKLSIPDTYY
ncbi:MAG: GNAT family N-acetyltransferase [Candidatus Hermodarchaeota archaeon]